MTIDKLKPEEKEMARQLWDASFGGQCLPIEKTRAFSRASQTVREAVYFATQQPQYRGRLRKNPFDT